VVASNLLPRLLDLRANATTVEIHELADIMVELLEREQRAEQPSRSVVEVKSGVDCRQCAGSGMSGPDQFCSQCNGDGVEWWEIDSRPAIEGATLKGSEP
jgi:hypothetical protein